MRKRSYLLLFLLFAFVLLYGCDKNTTVSITPATSETSSKIEAVVTLVNDYNRTNRVYDELFVGDIITLPIDILEDMVFVGWSDGETVYNNTLIVEDSLSLTAIYEDASDVFSFYSNPSVDWISIKGYTGNSKYLRVPETIDGYKVEGIASEAFKSTDIVEIELPNSLVRIYSNAFIDMPNLEKVSFYGDYFGTREAVISDLEYVNKLEQFSDVCQVTETTETGWKFSEGCPIIEVLKVYEPGMIPGWDEFTSYKVLFDLAVHDDNPYTLMIEPESFVNLPKLTTIVFPNRYGFFYADIFSNTPKLINLDFTDNIYFYTENNVVYKRVVSNFNPEDTKYELTFYPPGLTNKEFTVPDRISSIGSVAFNGNNHLEVINLSKNIETVNSRAFTYVYNLKEINVSEENKNLYSIDGVLYMSDILICYPRAKTNSGYIMPDNITIIAPAAFLGQKYLVDIFLNDGLLRIGYDSFTETEKIKILNVPSSVVYIDSLYYGESSLEIVIINRSVVTDGDTTKMLMPRANDFPKFYVPDDSYDDYAADREGSIYYYFIYRKSELSQ
jgi:hypothetical protein